MGEALIFETALTCRGAPTEVRLITVDDEGPLLAEAPTKEKAHLTHQAYMQ